MDELEIALLERKMWSNKHLAAGKVEKGEGILARKFYA